MELVFDDLYFMKKALAEAQNAYERGEVPIGAVVAINGKAIAKSHNLVELLKDVTAHAEMQAITAAANHLGGKYLTDCTLYVTLEPCVMCAGALYWSQLSRLVFAASDARRGFLSSGLALHPKTSITSGVMRHEAELLLKSFFESKRT